MRIIFICIFFFMIGGCASHPDNLVTSHVSQLQYDSYDCDQISLEMQNIERKTTILYNSLEKKHTTDNWQMGVGLVLFWPTLFFLEGGDGPEAAEYSRLRGEYLALEKTSISKKCIKERASTPK